MPFPPLKSAEKWVLNNLPFIECARHDNLVYCRTLKCGSEFFYRNFVQTAHWSPMLYEDIDWDQDVVFSYIMDPIKRRHKGLGEYIVANNLQAKLFHDPEFRKILTHIPYLDEHSASLHCLYKNVVDKIHWIYLDDDHNVGIDQTEKFLQKHGHPIIPWNTEYVHTTENYLSDIYQEIKSLWESCDLPWYVDAYFDQDKRLFSELKSRMILPDLILPSRANQRWKCSGIDSLDECRDREHFQNYPYPIEYVYNSRGFRDTEWPTSLKELQEAVWCFGDSFTVGIGQPLEHIWPNVLAQRINKRTINVSMDGASNSWICRRALDIVNTISPKTIVIMWSYLSRQESPNVLLDDEFRRLVTTKQSSEEDFQQWSVMVDRMKNVPNKVVQLSIPEFMPKEHNTILGIWQSVKSPSWPCCPQTLKELEDLPSQIKKELKELHCCFDDLKNLFLWKHTVANRLADIICINERLDWARDHHHFDILTSQWVVDQIENQLRT
jgi:hypothetical protein